MDKKLYVFLPVILLISGCATATTKKINALETKTSTLEAKVESIEQRQSAIESQSGESRESVGYLKGRVEGIPSGPSTVVVTGNAGMGNAGYLYKSGKASLTRKDIQIALKNAGFYNGAIDGKIGKKTKKAIREFQKSNGLKADGKVGPRTKELLLPYLKQETK